MNIGSKPQSTDFTLDVLGRYICNTFDEALANSDPTTRAAAGLPPRSDMQPFDFIVIGGGTFGGALAEHLWFRSTGSSKRILVLEAGPFLIPEHQQNLPTLGLGGEVWGVPWNSNVSSKGLAYCVGGLSIWWGGWATRLLDSETPASVWPPTVLKELNDKKLSSGDNGYFRQSGQQLGVTTTNDFIFGDLHAALREQLYKALDSRKVAEATPLASLPDAPPVEILDTVPALTELAALLGASLPNPLPSTPAALARLEQEFRNKLKLEAPLAVQARPEHAGFFPMNKFSTVPLLIKAARGASRESNGDDVRKRFMIVPRCHVKRLDVKSEPGGKRVTAIQTQRGEFPVASGCKIIIAQGAIESTRLALLSFDEDGRIGSNLMAHLRSNIDFQIPRTALTGLSPTIKALQSSALLVRGQHKFKKPDGTDDGTVGHFHLQITASGLGNAANPDSEVELFQTVPDMDTVKQHLLATDSKIVITIRGIGEMQPNNPNSNVTLDLNPNEVDYGERKAYVNLNLTVKDQQLWDAMDAASDELAVALANGEKIDIISRNPTTQIVERDVDATRLTTALPYRIPSTANDVGRRDGLGTTYHEAGTLRMGDDSSKSVTDANGMFHGVKNAYAVGLSVFPTVGSPNPMLTGIALARRLGDHLTSGGPTAPPPASDASGSPTASPPAPDTSGPADQ